jgi:hypothetical protein
MKTWSFIILIFLSAKLAAQPLDYKVDISRLYAHNQIDKFQKNILAKDGIPDDKFTPSTDEEINLNITYALVSKTDEFQKIIETDSTLNHFQKSTYLRGYSEYLQDFYNEVLKKKMYWVNLPDYVNCYLSVVEYDKKLQSIIPALEPYSYTAGLMITQNFAFKNNPQTTGVNEWLVRKIIEEEPTKGFSYLSKYAYVSFADSLITVFARKSPGDLYTYAQAGNTPLGKKIAASNDSLVKLIHSLANTKSGRLYFPFIDLLLNKKVTKDELATSINDSFKFYKLLVSTQINYAGRIATGDTPIAAAAVTERLTAHAKDDYVTVINGLHDINDPNIRYKKIKTLSPQELYYLTVLCEQDIYTSSFLYVFKEIYNRMKVRSTDSLFKMVNNNYYKKFITLSANYNTLDSLLAKTDKQSAIKLMTSYVNNLDKGRGQNDIEDAVDVANAYSSVKDASIKKLMLNQVIQNLDFARVIGNKKAEIIYRIEKLIMQSEDSSLKINLPDSLGVLPVYDVKNNFLKDTAGRIVLLMYFYGDGGGRGSFQSFVNNYGSAANKKLWKMYRDKNFVQFTSIGSKVPYVMFANDAKTEENDEDEKAQLATIDYMRKNGYNPSISVHRGHSYFLKNTIEKLQSSSKLVVLGSCGAYHNLDDVLHICNDAYIISSKQVGYGEINNALIQYLADNLKNGVDINWPLMQSVIIKRISSGKLTGFDDYVFPHKNLGAIFIKAYKIALQAED